MSTASFHEKEAMKNDIPDSSAMHRSTKNNMDNSTPTKDLPHTSHAAESSSPLAMHTRSLSPPFSSSSSTYSSSSSSTRGSSISSKEEEEIEQVKNRDGDRRERSRSLSSSSSSASSMSSASSSSFSSSSSSLMESTSASSTTSPLLNSRKALPPHSKSVNHKRQRTESGEAFANPSGGVSTSADHSSSLPSSSSSVSSSVNRNPHLQFEKSDTEYIPLPVVRNKVQMSHVLRILVEDTRVYPWKTYRMLDYFRTAVQMFIAEARQEYRAQHQGALRNGKPLSRFTWKNKGELAICFACLCDMLKLLYDRLRPGPLKPVWEDFVDQLAPLLMHGSRIPAVVLSANTYHTKFMDWQKGGTRYGGGSSRANVRFPSVSERQVKVETFLRSGVGYNIQAVVVDPSMIGNQLYPVSKPRPSSVPTPSFTSSAVSSSSTASPMGSFSNFASLPPGVGGGMTSGMRHFPLRPNGRATEHTGIGTNSSPTGYTEPNTVPPPPRQIPEEMRHLYWLSALAHIKGGDPTACFPDSRAPLMIAFGKLCEMSKTQEERLVLVHIIRGSSPGIHTIMERLGGLICFRQFAATFIAEGDSAGLMLLVDTVARLRTPCWSRLSQDAWCTDLHQKRGYDLQWLRQLPMIPTEKRAAWGALLLMMEEKFIFTLPLEEIEARRQKQQTQESSGGLLSSPTSVALAIGSPVLSTVGSLGSVGLQAATADNKILMRNWKWPRLHTFYARRLPDEWRAPMFLDEEGEAAVNTFIEKRQAFLDEEQERWKKEIMACITLARGGKGGVRSSDRGQVALLSSSQCAPPFGESLSLQTEHQKSIACHSISDSDGSAKQASNPYASAGTTIPLWYDPLELLGVLPSSKVVKHEATENRLT